ncbi:MAG TPA: 2-polyprenyl-3-methyl-6-methoxy-1,4-benzoquinone monooxygenase [Pseudomonadales bacterium]|nr:2-polyprenyl-3-methyl-6-methoxy-1,4-benzoquinone monooxygenase [Pseudomonadales bacterium]
MADSLLDLAVIAADRVLKTLAGRHVAERASPAQDVAPAPLDDEGRAHAAGLMRVNHAGEVCAQALYEGQAMVARDPNVRSALLTAAREEEDHLAWCNERLQELDSRPSVLNPLWYGVSFALGAATGLLGDKISLGFVAATEDQVCKHLDRHLHDLPADDSRSRAIVAQMRDDEARHGTAALDAGGADFPQPVKDAMTLVSTLMTATSYRV